MAKTEGPPSARQGPDGRGAKPSARAMEPTDEAAATEVALAAAPELVANTLGEYLRAWVVRIRAGESGVLPVIVGLIVIAVIFQTQNSSFLSAGNLTNLLVQGSAIMLLAMGEIFALLLGEIDLSVGFVSGIGGVVVAELVKEPRNWPAGAAIVVALLATTVIGLVQGTLITRLRLPSFVVTLAGLLGWQGLMIKILGQGGTLSFPPHSVINSLAGGNLTPAAGWILMAVVVAVFAGLTLARDARRRASGLVAPPPGLTILKIVLVAAAGVVLVLICNTNRGALVPLQGVPWVVPVVMAVLGAWTFLLGRTRFGRFVYAIGGNPEGARRAGINLAWVRTAAFALVGLTAGVGGIVYASRLTSVSTNLDGGNLVLLAVASAVIGGTSLFGGRGKAVHAVLGGIVIAAIANGMGLLGMSSAAQSMVTALVLLAAVTVDAVARRGGIRGSVLLGGSR